MKRSHLIGLIGALIGLIGAVVLVGGFLGVQWSLDERDAQAAAAERAEREAEEAREERRLVRLRRESEELIPELLEGVYLGMPLDRARQARPQMVPDLSTRNPEPDTVVFEERFPNGARAVYVYARPGDALERVQVLSLLPTVNAIAPHLAAMNAQYGTPTGIWDCPQTGGVPTRRFTWRHGETTVSDIFLVVGERVSVTLYIAPSDVIGRSLRMAACRPLRDPSELESFPVTTAEQVNAVGP
jgi:hypothetical protein